MRFVPLALGFMLGAPSSTVLVQKLGGKRIMGTGLVIVAAVMFGLAFLTTSTDYWVIGVSLLVLGIGMAWAMAPATDAVMAALPEEKAGVGSAVNDTSRQIGGALGIGIFGSILNSVYSSNVSSATDGLSAGDAEAAENSIGAALQVATTTGGAAGDALGLAAANAFQDGLGITFFVTAAVALVGGLFVFRYMPAHDVASQELHPVWEEPRLPAAGDLTGGAIPAEE